MNEIILTDLKMIVERAVRPVRATMARKRKMREELLAHVSGVFAQEVAQTGDDNAALEQTRLRFGDAAALSGELQKTVPPTETFDRAFEKLTALRPGESTLRRAGRHASLVGVLILAALALPFASRVGHRWSGLPSEAWLLGSVILAVCSAIFVYTFLSQWLRQSFFVPAGCSWLRASAVLAAAWLAIPMLVIGVRLEFENSVWPVLRDTLVTLPFFVVIPLLVAMCAWDSAAQARDLDEWASLKID